MEKVKKVLKPGVVVSKEDAQKRIVGLLGPGEQIELVNIDSVKLWKENPRKNEHAVEPLAALLKEHDQVTPIVVWKENNVVYKGNTTLKAMKLNGDKFIKVIFRDFKSAEAAVAYGISDNKSGEWSEWDEDILRRMMQNSKVSEASGFTKKEVKKLFFVPDKDDINKVSAAVSGLKDRIILILTDASQKDVVQEMVVKWLDSIKAKGVEIFREKIKESLVKYIALSRKSVV